jgi:short-subunit dehydrogenase
MPGEKEEYTARGKKFRLNVASSAGMLPAGPFMTTYYATKAYAASFTRAVKRNV